MPLEGGIKYRRLIVQVFLILRNGFYKVEKKTSLKCP